MSPELKEFTWTEVKRHNTKGDRWLVVEGQVYDVSTWCTRHPGGERLLAHHAGQDATDAWVAFHTDKEYVRKYMKPLILGKIKEDHSQKQTTVNQEITKDFRKLREIVEKTGLLKANKCFFLAVVGHIVALDLLGWLCIHYFGSSWPPYILGIILLATAQAQGGWSQHDFGHLSVFRNSAWNHAIQIFILNFMKGASSHWWNYRHYQHHAKPNVISKDPDIRMEVLFMLGEKQPKEWGEKKKGTMPYNHQQTYFYFIMPPLLLPFYFNYEIPYYLIKRKLWTELFWTMTFFVRWNVMFYSTHGFLGAIGLFLIVRFVESHWFVWCTQMSHIPMHVDYDHDDDWVTTQLVATCNVHPSAFNDWFSGHLNYQIEHHLFPTMPRHNYHKVAPLVRSLCEKHGLSYQSKSLFQAFKDIPRALGKSGDIWYEAYHM